MPNKPGTRLRGYGARHQRIRRKWDLIVKAGDAVCARCGWPIHPDDPWDLGHDDHNRNLYNGPEHPKCNRGAPRRQVVSRTSRNW